jgi:ankyrin repeat protein
VGFGINGLGKRNTTALCTASHFGELEVVAERLELGADIEVASARRERTALRSAAVEGRAGVTERLPQAGALVNAQDENEAMAVYLAAMGKHADVTELLNEGGANPNLTGPGVSPAVRVRVPRRERGCETPIVEMGEYRNAVQRPYSVARRGYREWHG